MLKVASLSAIILAGAQMGKEKEIEIPDTYTDDMSLQSESTWKSIDQEEIIPGVLYKEKGLAEASAVALPQTQKISYKSQEYQIEPGQFTQSVPMISIDLKIPELKKPEPQVEFVSEAISEPEPERTVDAKVHTESTQKSVDEADVPLDAFGQKVDEFVKSIDGVDLARTIELAKKPAEGTGGLPRIDYINSNFELRSEPDHRNRPAVPDVLQEELNYVVPGWVANESRFKKDALSKKKAEGYWQLKPKVHKELRGTEKVSLRADDQTDTSEDHVSDNYHYILHYAGDESLSVLSKKYPSEESFLREMMTPLMLTAYNVGGPTIGKKIKRFVESVPEEELKTGRDLFLQFIDFADLSVEGSEYAVKVVAFNKALNEKMSKQNDEVGQI